MNESPVLACLVIERQTIDAFAFFAPPSQIRAGRDTTAMTLSWMFYHVIAEKRIMKNVLKELDIVLGSNASINASKEERQYTYETMMQDLPYLKAIFHETLRLYPPVPRNGKLALGDDVLPDGTLVEKGDRIGFSTYAMGRTRSVWGEDAEVFSPERWLIDVDVKDIQGQQGPVSPFGKFKMENQHKFHSFNSGPRLCLVSSTGAKKTNNKNHLCLTSIFNNSLLLFLTPVRVKRLPLSRPWWPVVSSFRTTILS